MYYSYHRLKVLLGNGNFITGKCADDTDCIFNKFKNILDKNDPLVVRLFDDMIEAFENHQLIVH